MDTSLLAPAAVLTLWSLIMLFWMVGTRVPAMEKAGFDMKAPGGRGQDIDPMMPPSVAWKSHNYAHLMEQPTLFYAVIAILTMAGGVSALTIGLAWGYVGLRIVHSLWQSLVNTLTVRVSLFMASTLCLVGLSLCAVIATV